MNASGRREVLWINTVAWSGSVGVLALGATDVARGALNLFPAFAGFIFAGVVLGQAILSRRKLRLGLVLVALASGAFPWWAARGAQWFGTTAAQLFVHPGGVMESFIGLLALPLFIALCSLVAGFVLAAGTGSGGVGVQCLLAGVLAGGVTMLSGDPVLVQTAAGTLWCLVMFLSLSKWACDHVSRSLHGSEFIQLGQDGPLASLARGSIHTDEDLSRSDAA